MYRFLWSRSLGIFMCCSWRTLVVLEPPFSFATSWQESSRFHPADSLSAAQPILWAFLIQQEERQKPVKSCQADLLFTYH